MRGLGIDAPARLLSDGNFQKLILANPPTRVLDMGAAAEVGRRLLEARARGAGTLVLSKDMDEILGLADRITVIHDGQLVEVDTRDREDTDCSWQEKRHDPD